MSRTPLRLIVIVAVVPTVLVGRAISAQDKYTVQVPGGLALSDCRGYEDWTEVAASHPQDKINVIVANPSMIDAYRTGFPGNGKQVPDDGGSKGAVDSKTFADAHGYGFCRRHMAALRVVP